nr:thioredoxin domain-containing protein [bacterium]
ASDHVYCPVCQFPVDPDGPLPLDDYRISRFLEQVSGRTLILFWAPWDKESDEMYTLLAMESQKTDLKAIVASVNIAENPESRRQFGIEILPTVVMYAFGREVNRVVGPLTAFELAYLMKREYF